MDLQVVWAEPAVADLEAIVRYIAQSSPATAERVRSGILECVEILTRLPHIGPVYERDSTGRTREIVYRPYRIFYRVDETAGRVEILTVWHGSRQEPKLPE